MVWPHMCVAADNHIYHHKQKGIIYESSANRKDRFITNGLVHNICQSRRSSRCGSNTTRSWVSGQSRRATRPDSCTTGRSRHTCFGGEITDRVVVDLLEPFKLPKNKSDVQSGSLDQMYQAYEFGPRSRNARFTLNKELTTWRAENEWVRGIPAAYGRYAIRDAVTACGRVIDDCSDHAPYRKNDGRIIVGSIRPPVRRGDHAIYISGFGEVETKHLVNQTWDMRSFRLVEVTHRKTKRTTDADRIFELHIMIRLPKPEPRHTNNMRGVDTGGKHLAATVDLKGDEAIYNTIHKIILREIYALISVRDRHAKGRHKWLEIDKQIRILRRLVDGLATNTINQTINEICKDVDVVGIEILRVRDMTTHGGNRKKGMNWSMRANRVGEFLRKLVQKCIELGIILEAVPAKHTSQTCCLCGMLDPKSRVTRDLFVCTNCIREIHADINAAGNILHRAAGKVVQRRLGRDGNNTTPCSPLNEAPEKGESDTGWRYSRI